MHFMLVHFGATWKSTCCWRVVTMSMLKEAIAVMHSMAACREGSHELMQLLLEGGAIINALGGHFGASLQAASKKQLPKVKGGADI